MIRAFLRALGHVGVLLAALVGTIMLCAALRMTPGPPAMGGGPGDACGCGTAEW